MNIAIDGPAGAGKSTVAKGIAEALSILHLDTGAMYRALGLYALAKGVDPNEESAVLPLLPDVDISVKYNEGAQRTLLNGEDVTKRLRAPEVSKAASDIAVHPEVRRKLVALQQKIAAQIPVVMDGRDIGTVVLPDTPYKFYVTASPRIRAQRRLLEMGNGVQQTDLLTLERDILDRDRVDSGRACSPLCRAEGAIEIDTTGLTIDEAVRRVLAAIDQLQGSADQRFPDRT